MALGIQHVENMAGKDIQTLNQDFQDELGILKTNLDELRNNWDGGASDSYNGAYDGLQRVMLGFNSFLNDYGEAITKANSTLVETEEELTAAGNNLDNKFE